MGANKFRISMLIVFVFWVTVHLFGTDAFAQGNLKLGRLDVSTSFKYQPTWDDNIFLDPSGEEDDFYHVINPIITVGYTGSRPGNFFTFGYSGNWAFYHDFSDNNWTNQNPYVSMGYESPMGFYAKLDNNFGYSTDPFGTLNRFAVGVQTTRINNTFKPLLGYHLTDKWFTEAYYRNYFQDFDENDDKWQNVRENGFSGAIFRRITAKTSLLAEIRYNEVEYPKQNDNVFDAGRDTSWSSGTSQDNTTYDFFLGARFEPGGKILGELKLGYGSQNWKNSVDPLGNLYKDESDFVADIGITYFAGARTTFIGTLSRNFLGSPDADASSFVSMPLMVQWIQEYAYNLSSNVSFRWQWDDYLNEAPGLPKKYTNLFNIKARLSYALKEWATAAFEYEWEDISASDDQYAAQEYTVNRVKLVLLFTY